MRGKSGSALYLDWGDTRPGNVSAHLCAQLVVSGHWCQRVRDIFAKFGYFALASQLEAQSCSSGAAGGSCWAQVGWKLEDEAALKLPELQFVIVTWCNSDLRSRSHSCLTSLDVCVI